MNGFPEDLKAWLAQRTPTEKNALLVELLSEVAAKQQQPGAVPIQDDKRLIGLFRPHKSNGKYEYRPLPEEGTPEFYEEMKRRMESDEPMIPADEYLKQLREKYGEGNGID